MDYTCHSWLNVSLFNKRPSIPMLTLLKVWEMTEDIHSSSGLRGKSLQHLKADYQDEAEALWFWFHHYSMRVVLSALNIKKWDLCKTAFLCSEQQRAAPHGSDSLWWHLMPMQPCPQMGLLQGGLYISAFSFSTEKEKGKDGQIALWNITHSVFQNLLNGFTLRQLVILNRDEHHLCC